MVLTSQSPQPGARQLHMVSRRRKPRRWPWVTVVTLVVIFVIYRVAIDRPDPTQPISNGAIAAPPADPSPTRISDLPPPTHIFTTTPETKNQKPPKTTQLPLGGSPPNPNSTSLYAQGMNLIAQGKLVEGRDLLSRLLFDDQLRLRPADAQTVRETLTDLNRKLIFDPTIILPHDPIAELYTIKSGDTLSHIAPKFALTAEFVQRINNVDPRRLHVGKKLKLLRGPFHVRVIKHDYRLDIYLKDDLGQPLYVMSMPVGLGEADSTPIGSWTFTPGLKIKNPEWRNPRTNQYFAPNNPDNPIGEYWLALQGTDPNTESLTGYGIHGTIDPQSIGTQASMGCIRLRDTDIELLFTMIRPGLSTAQILP